MHCLCKMPSNLNLQRNFPCFGSGSSKIYVSEMWFKTPIICSGALQDLVVALEMPTYDLVALVTAVKSKISL